MEAAIPPVVLLILLIWGIRWTVARRGHGSGDIDVGGWPLASIGLRTSSVIFVAASCHYLREGGTANPVLLGLLAAQVPILLPSAFIDFVLIPLGLVAPTFWFSRAFMPLRTVTDPLAGAVLDAGRGLVRKRGSRDDLEEARLTLLYRFSSGAWICNGWRLVAWATLSEATGDSGRARTLFQAASRLRGRVARRAPRRLALRWLAARAAERGDWAEVMALGRQTTDRLHEAVLLGRITEVRLGLARPRPVRLILRWLATPSRWALLPLLLQALRRPADDPFLPAAPADAPSPLASALTQHARLLAAGTATTWALVAEAAAAWEAVPPGELEADLARRIAAHSARITPGQARAQLLGRVEDDLAEIIRGLREPRPDSLVDTPTLEACRERVLEERLATLESLLADFTGTESPWTPPRAADQWAAWATYRTAFDDLRLVASRTELREVLTAQWLSVLNHGADLYNARDERTLAGDLFVWLQHECRRLEVPADMKVIDGNAKISA